jgi:hypothetical protein
MIESAIISALKADSGLVAYISVYRGAPAVFSEEAPEDAETPYITIRISRSTEDLIVQNMNMYVDLWDYNKSRKETREAVEKIEFALDNKEFSTDRYSNIRCWFFSGSQVDGEDPRDIHYNQQFTIRATRKKFLQQL